MHYSAVNVWNSERHKKKTHSVHFDKWTRDHEINFFILFILNETKKKKIFQMKYRGKEKQLWERGRREDEEKNTTNDGTFILKWLVS